MTTEGKLAQLLDAATSDVPARHLAPPLTAIRGRARRRRRTLAVVTATAVVAVVAGGFSVGQRLQAAPAPKPAASPTAAAAPALPWLGAMVARDDRTITVYARAPRCEELSEPRARLTEQGADRVSIEVTARVVPAGDCTTSGDAVPISVTLDRPLGYRRVLDAVRGPTRPLYTERSLPDLRSDGRWSAVDSPQWQSDDPGWYQSYNGPDGSVLVLRAGSAGTETWNRTAGDVDFGPYKDATVTGNDAGMYAVWWYDRRSGGGAYSLQIIPGEGRSITLAQFKQELNGLKWS
jgi:hypothetical protein